MGGPIPVTWSEIVAYAQCSDTITEKWEMRALARMSIEYVQGLELGKNIFSISPKEQAEKEGLLDEVI